MFRAYQGTQVRDLAKPIANLKVAPEMAADQRSKLNALQKLNQLHRQERPHNNQLEFQFPDVSI